MAQSIFKTKVVQSLFYAVHVQVKWVIKCYPKVTLFITFLAQIKLQIKSVLEWDDKILSFIEI